MGKPIYEALLENRRKYIVQLKKILEDVPGDTLEQKIYRILHELEQAHKRIAELGGE